MAKAEGKKFSFKSPKSICTAVLETFEFAKNREPQYISTMTKEFSAVCPFSGLPDLAKVVIEYYPDGGKCVELKSLKYYFTSFRNVGLYQEGVTRRIYTDMKALLKTDRIRVSSLYFPRGGFDTLCVEGLDNVDRPLPLSINEGWK